MTPRPNRLILSGYGPLAGGIAVLLVITVTVPSKSPTGDEQFALAPGDQFSAASPDAAVIPGATTPVAAAAPGKTGKGAKGGQAATPAQVASAPQAQGVVPVNGGKRYIGATWPPKVSIPIPPAVAP